MNQYEQLCAQFYGNRLLFGSPTEEGVIAVEIASPCEVEILIRNKGELCRDRRPLRLFALVTEAKLLTGFPGAHRISVLEGNFPLRFIVHLDSIDLLDALRRHLRHVSGKGPAASDTPYLILVDPVEQYLMMTGTTYFMGMQFGDLRRMQLDIETYISGGFEFPSAARETDRIIAIAVTDSDGFERASPKEAWDSSRYWRRNSSCCS